MSETLDAIYDGRRVGQLSYVSDQIRFSYDSEWRNAADAFPLSLSMPLQGEEHRDGVVRPFIAGLLPDDEEVLKRWGQRFQVSARNPFHLLFHIGEECAGAIQFVAPERSSAWLSGSPPEGIKWLSDNDFTAHIEGLLTDRASARRLGDEGHFSLAGAQVKTALHHDPAKGRWGIPKGATPTTHIIKPNRGDFEAFEQNEHFCLQLANHLGLTAAHSWTEQIGGASVIIVERYDRPRIDNHAVRIHQEDCCQALARAPQNKYQNEGGPSAREIFNLIREHSSKPMEDTRRFLDALIFNVLIAGTDAHAKNYSLLIAGEGQVRLAPLYDLISIFPYPEYVEKKTKLAMKIGGDYLLWKIGTNSWQKAATEWKLDRDLVFNRIETIAGQLPDAVNKVATEINSPSPVIATLCKAITASATATMRQLIRAK